jgi:hypothetical protein
MSMRILPENWRVNDSELDQVLFSEKDLQPSGTNNAQVLSSCV